MRIAYLVHQYLPEHVGGTEIVTHGLARRAVAAGHEAAVFAGDESPSPRRADFVPRRWTHDGVAVTAFPYNLSVAPSIARFEYDNPHVAGALGAAVAKWRPDLVHVLHAMKLTGASVRACLDAGIPTVVTLTDFWFLCPRHTLLTWDGRLCTGPTSIAECMRCEQDLHGVGRGRRTRIALERRWPYLQGLLASVDRVIVLSPFLRDMFAANGFDSHRMTVLPHGIEADGLVPPRRSSGPVRLVSVSSVVEGKGVHVAIEALAQLPDLAVRLTVHGPWREGDPYAASLLARAAADERVVLAGSFPPADLGCVLADADYLVAPALWYENEPLAVKAARHVGLPVLASRVGSLAGMVEDDVDGWTAPPGDVGAWRDLIQRAVAAHEAGRRWGRRTQPTMDDHFSAVEAIYRQVVQAKNSSSA